MSTPQQSYYGPPPPQPKNGLGTAALVLGIVAAVFSFIPVVGIFLAIPLGILALIFGGIGMFRAFRGSASNKGVAISGTALGIAAFVMTGVMTAAVFGGGASPDPQLATDSGSGQQTQQADVAGVGDPVTDANLTFTVTGVDTTQAIGDSMVSSEAQGEYLIVNLTVENTGDESATFNAGPSQVALDSEGNKYETSQDAMMSSSSEDMNSFLQPINPGNSVEGRLVFDVPENTEIVKVRLQGGTFSSGAEVSLK